MLRLEDYLHDWQVNEMRMQTSHTRQKDSELCWEYSKFVKFLWTRTSESSTEQQPEPHLSRAGVESTCKDPNSGVLDILVCPTITKDVLLRPITRPCRSWLHRTLHPPRLPYHRRGDLDSRLRCQPSARQVGARRQSCPCCA
jgi:hypothetical protein